MSRSELDSAITSAMRAHSADAPTRDRLDGWIDDLERRQRRRRWLRPTVAAAAVVALAVGIGTATLSSRSHRTAVTPPVLPSVAESRSSSSVLSTSTAAVPQGPRAALPRPMAVFPGSACHGRYDPSLSEERGGLTVAAASVVPVGDNRYRWTVTVVNNTRQRQHLLAQPWISSGGSIAGKTLPGDLVTMQPLDYTTVESGARVELTGELGLYACSDFPFGTPENPSKIADPLAPGKYQIQIVVGNDVDDGTTFARSPIAVSEPVTVTQSGGVSPPGPSTSTASTSSAPASDRFEFCKPGALDLRTLSDAGLKTKRTTEALVLTNAMDSSITVSYPVLLTIINAAGDSLTVHGVPAMLAPKTAPPGGTVTMPVVKAAYRCSDSQTPYPDGTYSAIAVVTVQRPGYASVDVRTDPIVIAIHDGKVLIP